MNQVGIVVSVPLPVSTPLTGVCRTPMHDTAFPHASFTRSTSPVPSERSALDVALTGSSPTEAGRSRRTTWISAEKR
ncbi:hypothetical protein ACFTZG_14160 [Streptomyces albidoflavus]